ncbi:hypothetical protein DV517_21000 [Streptomyces sp. S816]|nr:hypothetical protein DV517_21000 [Streptomyces sp. S816]
MLLFLDVDGPLIPFGAADHAYPVHDGPPVPVVEHPLLTRVDPALGHRLAALGCELVWATTWMDEANAVLAPWLGLPTLPVVRRAGRGRTARPAALEDPPAGHLGRGTGLRVGGRRDR